MFHIYLISLLVPQLHMAHSFENMQPVYNAL